MSDQNILKLVTQRLDGDEYWLGSDSIYWVRLDFFLEYYISNNCDLSKELKKSKDVNKLGTYAKKLFQKFNDLTSQGSDFEYEKYMRWQDISNPEIQKVLEFFNS